MKCLALVLLAAALAPSSAFAQGTSTIKSDMGYPKSDVVGKAFDSGKYTIDPAYIFGSITMFAKPVAGGSGGQAVATVDKSTKTYTATIPGLTTGQKYNVFSILTVIKVQGATDYFVFTPDVVVTIK